MKQTTSHIMMIRPAAFGYNPETADNNHFQKTGGDLDEEQIQKLAVEEFDAFVKHLRRHDIQVIVFDDVKEPLTPDAVFPNNWVSFHEDGRVGLYPMFAPSRRNERREDIINTLRNEYDISEVVDFTGFEANDRFLEGTGSMILDRQNKLVYAALSERTDMEVLKDFCNKFDYNPVAFTANQSVGDARMPIYHTNVMMCVGQSYAIICLSTIDDESEKSMVVESLESTGKEIIEISEEQMNQFAGNMLEVASRSGKSYLVMSSSAYNSLNDDQVNQIQRYSEILHSPIANIELCGGGSARCMMAEVFLPPKA